MTEMITTLGKILDGDEQRDAIHIAIAPVIAIETLYPAQRIGLVEGTTDQAGSCIASRKIGIVDPFLAEPVYPKQKFWMFLYPNTITSLRHDWTHPAFVQAVTNIDESKAYIESIAAECDVTYNALIEIATDFANDGKYFYDNSETYKIVDEEKWPVFWRHFQRITGIEIDYEYSPFTCSC